MSTRAIAKAATTASAAPFRVGMKEVYLPNFTITLIRSDHLDPHFARFIVPLNMNKLDLRDYLYHAYNIRALSIRSFIELQPVRSGKPDDVRPAQNRWFRPKSIKKMTVEMDSPFVWPKTPTTAEELEPWGNETFKMTDVENEEYSKRFRRDADTLYSQKDRDAMRKQAKELLEGKTKWRPGLGVI